MAMATRERPSQGTRPAFNYTTDTFRDSFMVEEPRPWGYDSDYVWLNQSKDLITNMLHYQTYHQVSRVHATEVPLNFTDRMIMLVEHIPSRASCLEKIKICEALRTGQCLSREDMYILLDIVNRILTIA
ncbi:hypothetical protein TetV_145 [Tetraselmis virus 1]|uniref:Uncharacterized protein n=1 Tax=Tetraselmis virus 1 TaxID=2060617 RepID=A0A2P0VMV4_9VIRU|nr:hypothetical protein QJ968_gp145 [Tetraselmis virus 1]AUF82237.1 hypothetical protein TetV_145 [Tetraselmis virus 1]